MWRVLFIAFLLLHAWIQAMQALGDGHSWLLGDRKDLAAALTLAAAALFAAAGIGLWTHAEWWRAATVAGAAVSLAFFVAFFNPLILVGTALDVGLLVAVGVRHWPPEATVGA
jgi:hypothetical protein